MDQDILTRVEDGIATITLNRPQLRNSLSPEYMKRLGQTVQEVDANDAVRVIVLTGAGTAFSSGGDKDFLNALPDMTPDQVINAVYGGFQGAARAIRGTRKPTIAAVNGPAVGAGCELAVLCDFRVVARSAYLCENWIDLGIIPAFGGMFLLPRLIGVERANNMVLRATKVYGEEAKAIGLASEVADADALPDVVRQFATELAQRQLMAMALARHILLLGL